MFWGVRMMSYVRGDLRTVWRVLGLFGAFWGWSGVIFGRSGSIWGCSGTFWGDRDDGVRFMSFAALR